MAKAREPKVFRSMDDLPLMLTPYDLMDFLGKGQRQTYELIHSEGFPYVQDGPKISEALNVVFGGNHKFMIDLTLRGNQPIAEYYLNDDSVITKLEKPDYDRGGGKIDIIALALRLAVGEMEGVDGPLFLDEVGKHVSKEYAPSVAYFLKEYSATFGRQIILITHNADLAEIGEVSLAVKRSQSGESEVSVL